MKRHINQHGVTLVELLVTIAILGLVLAGIYGLMDTANRSYINTRAVVESQQTARVVLDYLLFRLREMDGSGLVKDPRKCTECHEKELDNDPSTDDSKIPCYRDVRIPRRSLFLEQLTTMPLPTLADVEAGYQNLSGHNAITFWADLLPLTGLPDEFTDSPRTDTTHANGVWDLTQDKDGDGKYDPGDDREVIYFDQNDDGNYDYYAEKWSFRLKTSLSKPYLQLVESLSFTHTTDKGGSLDVKDKNQSTYPDTGYTDQPVAYGIVGLGIKKIPKFYPDELLALGDSELDEPSCGSFLETGTRDTCHGNSVPTGQEWRNVYENETAFSYSQFIDTHPWWNVRGFSVEVATVDPQGRKFMKLKQILIPRNFEVNQEYYVE
ncbi:prepilin-type N-terminal cleavage/methylation domain-containing protein [candidate division KSB3 bacterium]|uniref:Prepilin-type N-terminal cleavage/methylation domain-containing protein n=1 Tax=candidate division KSB3 bacterium TaxID=2044937 RepID=A0A9D5JUC5_9BACT|nr:prepilin-type N-terminal cleavage/methylation domain-containing protein [candidate division KSB3 bacterium]MBD3324413.1 prepilin-type N-terminal cleavage/methylation domain-containing protein [candidate division KSB3 bacterium]